MGLVVKAEGQRQLAPAGPHLGVCVDVVDLGVVETEWQGTKKMQHKCRIVFELDEKMADGRRYTIGRRFTASLAENAALRKFLEQWRGKAFTPDELKGFDLEVLLGAPAVVQVTHTERGGKTYDDINSVMKPMKGMKPQPPSGDYVRVKDREPDASAPVQHPAQLPAEAYGDFPPPLEDGPDDLPF